MRTTHFSSKIPQRRNVSTLQAINGTQDCHNCTDYAASSHSCALHVSVARSCTEWINVTDNQRLVGLPESGQTRTDYAAASRSCALHVSVARSCTEWINFTDNKRARGRARIWSEQNWYAAHYTRYRPRSRNARQINVADNQPHKWLAESGHVWTDYTEVSHLCALHTLPTISQCRGITRYIRK
jgi:hypothetical protein